MEELGGFFGNMIIVFYVLAILDYFVKLANRIFKEQFKKNEKFHQVFIKLMRLLVKQHGLFGLLTIIFILLHFFIQYNQSGMNITGTIAAGVMLLQVILGIYGKIVKKRSHGWLIIHRAIAVVLVITILIHVA